MYKRKRYFYYIYLFLLFFFSARSAHTSHEFLQNQTY